MMIIQNLAPLLPAGYQAGPRVHLGSYFQVDIDTFENDDVPRGSTRVVGNGGVATVPEAELSLRRRLASLRNLNFAREHLTLPDEAEPVGIFLYGCKDDAAVHYATGRHYDEGVRDAIPH
jgi:hypothetical protein